jgi:exonuclease III
MNGYKLFYARNRKASLSEGLITAVADHCKTLRGHVYPMEAMEGRILGLRIKNTAWDITLINCYAPTEDSDEPFRTQFWDNLDDLLDRLPARTVPIVGGDFNGHVGLIGARTGTSGCIGRCSPEPENQNGKRLREFSERYGFMVTNTFFRGTKSGWTWQRADELARHRIDYWLVPSKLWYQVDKGSSGVGLADPFIQAGKKVDHRPVYLGIMKTPRVLDLPKKSSAQQTMKKLNHTLLADPSLEQVQALISHLDEALARHIGSSYREGDWSSLEQAMNKAIGEVEPLLQEAELPKKPWMTVETWNLILERRPLIQARLEAEREIRKCTSRAGLSGPIHTLTEAAPPWVVAAWHSAKELEKEAQKRVHLSIRRDKQSYMEEEAARIHRAMEEGNLKAAFSIAKRLAGIKLSPRVKPVDHMGKIPVTDAEELGIWAHFLQEERGMTDQIPTEWHRREEGACMEHLPEEVLQAIFGVKQNRAVMPGTPPISFYRAFAHQLAPCLAQIFDVAANQEYPSGWRENGLFWIKKPQKEGRAASSFRDICLMQGAAKIYSKCMYWRVRDQILPHITETQFGFLPKKGTTDAIALAQEIVARCKKQGRHLMIASFDLSQAFYKLNRTRLEEALTQRLYDESTALQILRRTDGVVYQLSQGTEVVRLFAEKGVVVGDVMGPLLFVLYMQGFLDDLQRTRQAARWPTQLEAQLDWQESTIEQHGHGSLIPTVRHFQMREFVSDVLYADDHDAFRVIDSWRACRLEVELLRDCQRRWHMDVNIHKSSIMVRWVGKGSKAQSRRKGRFLSLSSGEKIPLVSAQTHLGLNRTWHGNYPTVEDRVQKAKRAHRAFQRKLLGKKSIPVKTRIKLFKALVLPVLSTDLRSWC